MPTPDNHNGGAEAGLTPATEATPSKTPLVAEDANFVGEQDAGAETVSTPPLASLIPTKDCGGHAPAAEASASSVPAPVTITAGTSAADDPVADSCNSSNSYPVLPAPPPPADWPKPIDEAAFHGVLGKIVRLLEPHTEADPVALLIQLLVGVGNIIGRNAYFLVEGSRHHFNLFAVLVGNSAKARKGTSWDHAANILGRIDPEWKAKCVKSGLSSGEGLMFAIRDPMQKTQPTKGKEMPPLSQSMVQTDPGCPDKRLFIAETEFATCLKVSMREGNTLSTVLRDAWDGKDLNSMVKHNPTRVSNPHVSIVGHITREELGKRLAHTDMRNGFASRFLWPAVRRSKLLPEGGNLAATGFSAEVNTLRAAVEFAKGAGEIVRSDAARQMWRKDYPKLSEGGHGVVGAVTSRAEAQVTRLSGLYALMDGSSIILPEHHQAAKALWEYCERSARWIFGDSTGNKDADKLLAALRGAGGEGMTVTDISVEVFKKNKSSYEIKEALAKLVENKLIMASPPGSGGRSRERWIVAD